MEIKQVSVEDLKPADYNPRILGEKQYYELKKSLEEFGLVDPILVNSNPDRFNIIIGGHQRFRVAKDLGYKEVPVYYINLSEEKEKALNLRLNKNVGEWDFDALANYFNPDMLFEVGFSEKDLGLNQIPTDDFNKSDMGTSAETYLEGTIKQLVFFFKGTDHKEDFDFGDVLERLEKVAGDTNTDKFITLLRFYENNKPE